MKHCKTKLIAFFLLFYGSVFGQFTPDFDFTEGSDREVTISADGKRMAFLSDVNGTFRLYEAELLSNNEWKATPIDVVNSFRTAENLIISAPSFSGDGAELFFAANFDGNSDIWVTKKVGDTWSTPTKLPEIINTVADEGSPSISANGKVLIFTRPNPEPQAKLSVCSFIFLTTKDKNGNWIMPEMLPELTNNDCEKEPFICTDNRTIYFSSNREGNIGGFDLYKTIYIAPGIFSDPSPITFLNTVNDEGSPSMQVFGNKLIFSRSSSDRRDEFYYIEEETIPNAELPAVNLFVEGVLMNRADNKPIDGNIVVYNPNTEQIISTYAVNPLTGSFSFPLQYGFSYKIDFFKDGFSHVYKLFDTKDLKEDVIVKTDISIFDKVNLKLNVFDNELFYAIPSQIAITDAITGIAYNVSCTEFAAGRYNVVLPIGKNYKITVKAANYEMFTLNLNLSDVVQFDEFERDVELITRRVPFSYIFRDEETQEALPVTLTFRNKNNDEVITLLPQESVNGVYSVMLREGDEYEITATPMPGYAFYDSEVSVTTGVNHGAQPSKEVNLKPLTANTTLAFQNITFETNSAELNVSSYEQLNQLIELLAYNKQLKVEISAHTDDVGSNAYNMKLSIKRAESVVAYLVENNIPNEQLVAKGYGEEKPMLPNSSEENKAVNRRVELKVL